MALKELAVLGLTTKFVNPSHTGIVTIISSPSTKVTAENKGVYKDLMNISITNGSDGSTTTNATGSGVINATSTKIKIENIPPIRKGDQNLIPILMTGTNNSPPPPTSTYTTIVEIDNPGQVKVYGE